MAGGPRGVGRGHAWLGAGGRAGVRRTWSFGVGTGVWNTFGDGAVNGVFLEAGEEVFCGFGAGVDF